MSSSSRQIAVARAMEALIGQSRVPAASVHDWLRRHAGLGTVAATVLFLLTAGAGHRAQAQTSTPTFTSVYSFTGGTDGAEPFGSVVEDSSGNIYGTTQFGGAAGDGTVFKISSSGESVCYSFTGQNGDGAYPVGGLLLSGSTLYGTANTGGLSNGNVFEVPTSCGTDSILYNFGTSSPDGANPTAGLILAPSGNFYGTTLRGGDFYNDGTVFAIDPSSSAETLIHEFQGSLTPGDGANPYAGLISDKSGNLYGTTENGGAYGAGTVFKIDSSGNETVLYSFGSNGSTDGATPYGGLVLDSQGNLYGTTELGGTYNLGTVFKIGSSGNETVLYSFTGAATSSGTTDGAYPLGGLVMDSAGNLYGTTYYGGDLGGGTVFEISPSGTETQLHSFSGTDGALPIATLMLDSSNVLWGTTFTGGANYEGTVFKIALPSSSIPFSAFSAKLNATSGPPPGFNLQAYFTPGSGGAAINPVTQGMTLSVGNYTVTISPSTFTQSKKGWWVYSGTIGSASVSVRISQKSTTSYELQFSETGVDITSGPNPATITLTIGNNTGTTTASL